MKRRSFIKSLAAAVALMAADPMFGGRAWGMDRGIDRRPGIMVLEPGQSISLVSGPDGDWTVITGPKVAGPINEPHLIKNSDEFIEHFGDPRADPYTVEEPGDQENPWILHRAPQRESITIKAPGDYRISGSDIRAEEVRPRIINVGEHPITFTKA